MANLMEGYYQDAAGIYHRQFAAGHKPPGPGGGQFTKGSGGKGGAAPAGGGGALPAGTHKMADGKIHMNVPPGKSALGAEHLNALKGHVKEGDSVSASTRNSGSINGTVSHVADGKLHLKAGTGGATHIGPEHNVVALHVTPKGGTNSAEGAAHAGNAGGLKAAGSGHSSPTDAKKLQTDSKAKHSANLHVDFGSSTGSAKLTSAAKVETKDVGGKATHVHVDGQLAGVVNHPTGSGGTYRAGNSGGFKSKQEAVDHVLHGHAAKLAAKVTAHVTNDMMKNKDVAQMASKLPGK